MMKKIITLSVILNSANILIAQNAGIGTIAPNTLVQLDVTSNTKGILIPRMTETEKNAHRSTVSANSITIFQRAKS